MPSADYIIRENDHLMVMAGNEVAENLLKQNRNKFATSSWRKQQVLWRYTVHRRREESNDIKHNKQQSKTSCSADTQVKGACGSAMFCGGGDTNVL